MQHTKWNIQKPKLKFDNWVICKDKTIQNKLMYNSNNNGQIHPFPCALFLGIQDYLYAFLCRLKRCAGMICFPSAFEIHICLEIFVTSNIWPWTAVFFYLIIRAANNSDTGRDGATRGNSSLPLSIFQIFFFRFGGCLKIYNVYQNLLCFHLYP